jgi:hypothetical protein
VRAAGLTEEARQQRELTEALGRVPHEVLLALDELLDAIERGEDPDALVGIPTRSPTNAAAGRSTLSWISSLIRAKTRSRLRRSYRDETVRVR